MGIAMNMNSPNKKGGMWSTDADSSGRYELGIDVTTPECPKTHWAGRPGRFASRCVGVVERVTAKRLGIYCSEKPARENLQVLATCRATTKVGAELRMCLLMFNA